MNIAPAFDFSQARIQARYGERPDEPVWTSLEQTSDFGRYLQQIKATGMSCWVEKLGTSSDVHEIEMSLRQAFRAHIQEVADWVPEPWRAAVLWFGVLIDLEPLGAAGSGRTPPDWIMADVDMAMKVDDWRQSWRERWPPTSHQEYDDLRLLEKLVPFASYEEIPTEQVERTFRRCSRHPTGIFSWLILVLGDVMRLRGGLVRRRAFDKERN